MHQSNVENIIRPRFVDYILSMTCVHILTVENRSIPRTRRILINSERIKPLSFICLLPIVCALMLLALLFQQKKVLCIPVRCLSLQEYQSKKLMADNGVSVQKFVVCSSLDEAKSASKNLSKISSQICLEKSQ